MKNKVVKAILSESIHAKKFSDENLIHQDELEKIEKLISDAVSEAVTNPEKDNLHNTISVLGTRGSGKTSFLLSVLEKHSSNQDVEVLKIIDPTLIEEKGHVFLNVISAISELVGEKLGKSDLNPLSDTNYRKNEWRQQMLTLAAGIPSIDGIPNNMYESWQDPEFVMENGLTSVTAARNLSRNFNDFLKLSLKILGKKAFLVTFDDIDVDATKGITVLETIRKYFTSARLITILSGDLKLYSMLIRQKKWDNFSDRILEYEGVKLERLNTFDDMVTELTAQYLLKIMRPKMRIYLTTLLEKRNAGVSPNLLLFNENSEKEKGVKVDLAYQKIFSAFGINNPTQQEVYRTFILGQPLRSQIQFLASLTNYWLTKEIESDFIDNKSSSEGISAVFLADLLEKNVDFNLANNAPKYLNIIILKLLLKGRRLHDLYQLQPSTTDTSLNACLFSLTMIEASSIRHGNLYLIFDYIIRIGYMRNLIGLVPYGNIDRNRSDTSEISIDDLCEKAGVLNDTVLRDTVCSIQSYLYGVLNRDGDVEDITESFIQLKALQGLSRRPLSDRIDTVFSKQDLTHTLGYIPSFCGAFSYKNETRVAFSIYTLIATIGEIIKRHETSLNSEIDNNDGIAQIKIALKELSQLRTYPIPGFARSEAAFQQSNNEAQQDENQELRRKSIESEGPIDIDDDFAKALLDWLRSANSTINVSPHLLGKISTRFAYAIGNIISKAPKKILLGDFFHSQIIAFMNAILIEDVKENLPDFSNININNTNFDDNIFINNLKKVLNLKRDSYEQLKLSRWLLSCPLLTAYVREDENDIQEMLKRYCGNNFSADKFPDVYSLLNRVSIRTRNSQNETNVKILVNQPSKELLRNRAELISYLRKNKIPYEWFKETDDRSLLIKRNKEIEKRLPSIFGNDYYTSGRIRRFRTYLNKKKIVW